MRRRYLALTLGMVVVVVFAFFVPIAYVPLNFAECGYGCFSHYQYSSLTGVLIGHGGYYFEGHYSFH